MRRTIQWGLVAAIYAAVLFFGGTEPLSWAGVQIVVFLLFAAFLWAGWTDDIPWRIPWKGALLLAGYVLAQRFFFHHWGSNAAGATLKLLAYLCVFYVALAICARKRSREQFVVALVALALIEAFYGLIQYLAGWQYIFTYQKKLYTLESTGTYINPNHYAGFLEMVLPLVFVLMLYQLRRLGWAGPQLARPITLDSRSQLVPQLVFLSFTSLLIFIGLLFSRSRMGILSATTAVAVEGGLWASSGVRRKAAIAVLAGFLAAAVLAGAWIGLGPVAERYQRLSTDYQLRLAIWRDTVSLIRVHPLFGTGFGTYVSVYPSVQTTSLALLVDHAHNDYLEILAELGVLGAGLLFGLVLSVPVRGISAFYTLGQTREGYLVLGGCGSILAILFHSITDFNLQIPGNALVFAAILGLVYALSMGASRKS